MAKAFVASVQPFLKELFTYWMSVPGPDLETTAGPVLLMHGSLHWFTVLIGTVALAIGGARLVLTRSADQAVNIARSLGVLFFAAWVAVPLFNILLTVGDGFSEWLMNRAAGGSFQERFLAYLKMDTLNQLGVLSMILVSLAAVLGGLAQLLCMFLRNAALLVVLGIYPLAAAAAATAAGRSWFQKLTGWTVALVLFKPAASIIYATAFLAIQDQSSTINVILGVVLVVMATLALPALMKLAAPATAAVASGGSGMAGLAGVGGAVATGALAWQGRSAGGGQNSAPAPANGPSGINAPSGVNTPPGAGTGGRGSSAPAGRPPHSAPGTPGADTAGVGAPAGANLARGVAAVAGPAGVAVAAGQAAQAAVKKVQGAVHDSTEGPSGAGGTR